MDHGKIPLLQKMAGDMKTIADEEGWSWTQWTYKDIEEMGLVSPRSDTPWKAFLNSPEVNAERDKARPLIDVRGDGAEDEKLLTKYTAAIGASLDWTNRQNFDLRLERVYDEELSYAILVHLRNRTEEQMRALADSFAYDSCRPNPELTAVF